jgi:hypothetical protein
LWSRALANHAAAMLLRNDNNYRKVPKPLLHDNSICNYATYMAEVLTRPEVILDFLCLVIQCTRIHPHVPLCPCT